MLITKLDQGKGELTDLTKTKIFTITESKINISYTNIQMICNNINILK